MTISQQLFNLLEWSFMIPFRILGSLRKASSEFPTQVTGCKLVHQLWNLGNWKKHKVIFTDWSHHFNGTYMHITWVKHRWETSQYTTILNIHHHTTKWQREGEVMNDSGGVDNLNPTLAECTETVQYQPLVREYSLPVCIFVKNDAWHQGIKLGSMYIIIIVPS